MIWFLLTVPLLFIAWMVVGIREIQHVRAGEAIRRDERPRKALVIIDMQTGFLESAAFEASEVVAVTKTIRKKTELAKSEGMLVVVVQHLWKTPQGAVLSFLTAGGAGRPGKPGSALLRELEVAADHVIVKRVQDSFESGELDRLFTELAIGDLHIAGLDGLYCVDATARAALQRGYGVSLVENGILSSDEAKWAVLSGALSAHPCFVANTPASTRPASMAGGSSIAIGK